MWQLTQADICITMRNTEVKIMITLRLDPKLEQAVNMTAKNLGLTKSELIRKCIADYMAKSKPSNAWDTGKDLFGKYSSGKGNLSSERKVLLKEKIRSKQK
jgi:RHH-type transcriptional regulator, rel operon repressor / antitoxin RelB